MALLLSLGIASGGLSSAVREERGVGRDVGCRRGYFGIGESGDRSIGARGHGRSAIGAGEEGIRQKEASLETVSR